ncbi:MAG: SpvB/TcaC N-terminal domain-containing protein, partial [Candidatus Komeilibacteria bacterium]|nr:SpvB/TcaC N-terminal domain-containing protein [Candidatus Komeilibacteria bacterium]
MKKSLIIFLAFTFIIGTPGLMLAAEEAVSSPTIDSSSSVSQPTDPSSTVVLEAPTIVDPLETLKSAEQNITDTQISEPLQPESTKIIDSSSSVGSGIVADPVNPVVDANLLNNEAVDAGDEPGRDPGEEEGGAYQQEKSANNSFKKQAGLTGQLRVDQFSGAASYNIGLEAPAGRNGLNPSLLLAYNSHDKSGDSWVGQGWSLPLGSISRTSKRGTNNLYTSNEFTLFLGGSAKEIIEIDADNRLYAPKEESDFLQIQYLPDSSSWLVTDTQGIKYYFGQSVDSRHNDPDDQDKIYSWKLDKVVDTNENFYRVEYLKREGAIYPARFVYTGHGQTDGPMEILFNLEERGDDVTTSYQTQFLVTTDRRLNNIEIKVSGQTISRYQLAYTAGQNGRTLLLASITKKGYQNNQEFSLPATTFTYSTKQAGWDEEQDLYQGIGPFNKPDNGAPDPLVDFNGDSWVDRGSSFNDGNGFGGGEGWSFPNLNLGEGHSYFKYVTIGDFNGDKLPDLVSVVPVLGNQGQYISRVWLNNGVNGFSANNSLSQS